MLYLNQELETRSRLTMKEVELRFYVLISGANKMLKYAVQYIRIVENFVMITAVKVVRYLKLWFER